MNSYVEKWLSEPPNNEGIEGFVEGPGIKRIPDYSFDIERLKSELGRVVDTAGYDDTFADYGFGTLPVTRRPGTTGRDLVDLSGRFWTRPDDTYEEHPREDEVAEAAYSELMPEFEGTYFAEVVATLGELGPIGRVRVNTKDPYNANSWHRDPEPRLHIPLITNPGSLFIVNNHCTHLPADGSVYLTDTRGYHTALNGGEHRRVHLIAALAIPPVS